MVKDTLYLFQLDGNSIRAAYPSFSSFEPWVFIREGLVYVIGLLIPQIAICRGCIPLVLLRTVKDG